MMQMATIFAEPDRSMIRARTIAGPERVRAEGTKALGRPEVGPTVEQAIAGERLSVIGIRTIECFRRLAVDYGAGDQQTATASTHFGAVLQNAFDHRQHFGHKLAIGL